MVVNKSNNIGPLSRAEVRRIFVGEKSSSPGGNDTTVLMLAPDKPERGVILREVLKMNESDYTKYFLQAAFTGHVEAAPKDLPSAAQMKARLAANPNAIGTSRRRTWTTASGWYKASLADTQHCRTIRNWEHCIDEQYLEGFAVSNTRPGVAWLRFSFSWL